MTQTVSWNDAVQVNKKNILIPSEIKTVKKKKKNDMEIVTHQIYHNVLDSYFQTLTPSLE